ncbi:hypothetical protein HDV03_002812 [Kappamyces sp. JEL0829]|nr:hypothetical protein HDV03_002812 [Kappamyces sp. JEL0829]
MQTVPCTMNAYEQTFQAALSSDGMALLDSSAPWCGQRYSVLNNARIVSVSGMSSDLCNQCIEIVGAGSSVYAWAVDQREAHGLDIAESSYQALFPNSNLLDPQTCQWRVVSPSYCGTICYGSAEECTPGVKNLLPASLLPSVGIAPQGLGAGKAVQAATTVSATLAATLTVSVTTASPASSALSTSQTSYPASTSSSINPSASQTATGSSNDVYDSGPSRSSALSEYEGHSLLLLILCPLLI